MTNVCMIAGIINKAKADNKDNAHYVWSDYLDVSYALLLSKIYAEDDKEDW